MDLTFIELESCPQNTHQRRPFPGSPVIDSIKKCPSFLQSNPDKKKKSLAPSALQSKLANVELSDLRAETIHTEYAVCSTTPTSYCCVCMAALVKLKWVFPPREAEHDMR